MTSATIRPMRAEDVAPATEIMRRGEWADRSVFLGWAIDAPWCHPLVADDGDRILGTGIATAYGPVGWVGTIFVDPEMRGQGLGRTITRAVVEDLEERGCRTLLLIASEHGRPLYEREGFSVQTAHRRFAAPGIADLQQDELVRPFGAEMLPAILALDREATGVDRGPVIEALATPESTLVAVAANGSVGGFLLRGSWGGGGLIAPNPDDAVRLLDWRRRHAGADGRVATGLPASNETGRARLLAEGWIEEPGGTRMIRGEPLEWHPEAVWGQVNGALG